MKMVIGLGNPGKLYAATRHNVGFRFVDRVAADSRSRWRRVLMPSLLVCRAKVRGTHVILGKPQTYMNRSGSAILWMLRRWKLQRQDLAVIYDDTALPPGRIRIRARGGAGGHNGLQSVIEALGSEEFARVRIGVGSPPEGTSLTEHVLDALPPDEEQSIEKVLDEASEIIAKLIRDGLETVMNIYNGRM